MLHAGCELFGASEWHLRPQPEPRKTPSVRPNALTAGSAKWAFALRQTLCHDMFDLYL